MGSANYRIGSVGHLAPTAGPHLPHEDLLCAPRCVNTNIAALGGGPDRVTAGQSAGGWYGHPFSVLPEARGLLHRVAHLSMAARAPRADAPVLEGLDADGFEAIAVNPPAELAGFVTGQGSADHSGQSEFLMTSTKSPRWNPGTKWASTSALTLPNVV
ncbi:carboxylesterase family protein [Arthrobacter sp. GCM10027362]|uniref:carboxylesterase family protein n=1 Tax=Arthrobacter sp. GCM10027362 TaxID=3273379 RepID=UPI00362F88E9